MTRCSILNKMPFLCPLAITPIPYRRHLARHEYLWQGATGSGGDADVTEPTHEQATPSQAA